MEKDTHLVNIYLKIHNKRSLTINDLRYLAKYDPECFEKTCKNVVYNVPEAKAVMESDVKEYTIKRSPKAGTVLESGKQWDIEQVLENIKRLEAKELPVADVDAGKVMNLLGSLYMEMLFPHNDKEAFIDMPTYGKSLFDKKA
ncbi:MAG: hypothetical protein IKU69_00650 [Roseburia sp.]|nr:hypothetical protein [Roseburia sp.]